MKFTANLSDFAKLMQKVILAVPQKTTLPVLEHIMLSLDGDTLIAVATDQDIFLKHKLPVQGISNGRVLAPARRLNDIIKSLGSGEFTFSSNDDNFDIHIVTTNGNYTIKGLNPDDYIQLPELFECDEASDNNFKVDFSEGVLQRLANKTAFAVSTDEYRPSMNGALFQFRNGYIYAVATDGFRLVRVKSEDEKYVFEEPLDIIIPLRMLEILRKSSSSGAQMRVSKEFGNVTHVRFDFGDTIVMSRVIDEKFPPYESVIPKESSYSAVIDRKSVLSSLKRASLFSDTLSRLVRMHFDNEKLVLSAQEEVLGNKAEETLPCEFSGESLVVGFNAKNLESVLSNADSSDKIELRFMDAQKPVVVVPQGEDDNLLQIVMPIRV